MITNLVAEWDALNADGQIPDYEIYRIYRGILMNREWVGKQRAYADATTMHNRGGRLLYNPYLFLYYTIVGTDPVSRGYVSPLAPVPPEAPPEPVVGEKGGWRRWIVPAGIVTGFLYLMSRKGIV